MIEPESKEIKKIAVVILNWNGLKLLQKFIPSIVNYSNKAVIYVIDNASSDNSISWLNNHYPQIIIIENQINLGFAAGYNEGLKNVNEPYWILLNSDVEVTPNWLQRFIEIFDENPKIAAIQPKIINEIQKKYFEYAGAGGGYLDALGYPYCRGRILDKMELDSGQYDDEREVHWASGACLAIRKNIFEKLNGFDEDFFAHQEEIDLCWRIRNDGFQVFYTGKSVVYHLGGGTLEKNSPKKIYLNFRNNLSMLAKNLPKSKIIPIIFIRLILDGIAGIQYLLNGKTRHFFAIIQAHIAFYKRFFKMYQKRPKSTLRKYYHHKSMLTQIFLKNGTYFDI